MSETHSTITLSHSLATDPRTHLEAWLEDVETQARHQCPQHDITGALTLVVPDIVWNMVPCNIVAGTPPTIRACPTWDMPQQHSNTAGAAVVSIYRENLPRTGISEKRAVPSSLPFWTAWAKPIEPSFERLFPR
jgi:hypothetical protein